MRKCTWSAGKANELQVINQARNVTLLAIFFLYFQISAYLACYLVSR